MLAFKEYKTGTDNAFMCWVHTPSQFLTRIILWKTKKFSVMLHWFRKGDPEPFMHDHPVSFWSFILWGSYVEMRRSPRLNGGFVMFYGRKWFNRFKASPDERHRIVGVKPGGCLTLVFAGPKVREWGYHTDHNDPSDWIYWRDYQAAERLAGPGGDWRKHLYPTLTDPTNHL
jgi:hypothetical protein